MTALAEGTGQVGRAGCDQTVTWGVTSVLVVAGDTTLQAKVVGALCTHGYTVRRCTTGCAAMHIITVSRPDVVLLAVEVGDVNALTLCRWIRSHHPHLPVVFVAADGCDGEIVAGLDAGASDYLVTPLSPAVLLARVRARVRAASVVDAGAAITIGGLRIDRGAHRVFLDHRELEPRPKEFALLVALARQAGRVVTRAQLLGEVWDLHWASATKTLDMHIYTLRRLLCDDPAAPTWITTVRRVGYRFATH